MEDNHNLIYSFLEKYNLSIDEHYDLAAIGLCKASITYDGSKSKFSTYAYKCMFNSVICELRKELSSIRIPKHKTLYYQEELEKDDGDKASLLNIIQSNEDVENEIISKIMLENYTNTLSERDKTIFDLSIAGYKQIEISEVVGCSRAQVSRVKNKFKNYLSG